MAGPARGLLILPDFLIDRPGEPPKRGWGVRVLGSEIDEVGPNEALRQAHPDDPILGGGRASPLAWISSMHTLTCTACSPTGSRWPARRLGSGLFWRSSGGRWSRTGSTMP